MNKKLIIGVIVVVIVLGFVWLYNSNKEVENTNEPVVDNTPSAEEAATQETNQLIDETVVDEDDSGEVDLGDVI